MTDHPRSARQPLADYGLSEGVISGILDIHAHELATPAADRAERRERYAVAIHDAMEPDLSLVDQEPGAQALFARAAEAAEAVADTEHASLNRRALTLLGDLGIATHRLDCIRDAARLHRQQLIGTSELYAVIEADDGPPAAAPAADRAAILCDAADIAYRRARRLDDQQQDQRAQGAWDVENELRSEARMAAGTQQPDTEARCVHCMHPKRDHDGRADHRARHSPLVAGDPWCHACNATCDYTGEAQPISEAGATATHATAPRQAGTA